MEKFKTELNGFYYPGSRAAMRSSGMKDQLDWIKRQLEYASFSEKYCLRYDLKRGEIYEFDWGINVNAEFSNRHYGVVLVDSDIYNPLVTVCPLKTNHGGCHPKSDVDLGFIEDLQSPKPTLAIVNQIRTIDKLRIYTKRAIGVADTSTNNIEDNNRKYVIYRLEEHKLKMILEAYKNYLAGEELM